MLNNDMNLTASFDTFRNYCLLERDLRSHTIVGHISCLRVISRYLRLHNLNFDYDGLRSFLIDTHETKSPGTRRAYIFTTRVYCDFLICEGILKDNFARKLKMPKKVKALPDVLSVEEIDALLSVKLPRKSNKSEKQWDTLIYQLATTGCRIGELLSSKIDSYDLKKNIWKIQDSKTRLQRYVPLSPKLSKLLTSLFVYKKAGDYAYTSVYDVNGKEPIRAESVRQELENRAKTTGITKSVTPHIFRHSFITELLRQDISILKVAMLVGHEEIGTTQRYAKLVYEDLRFCILRHPILARSRNPYEILENIKEELKRLHLSDDKRFFYELSEGNDGIRLNLFIR